jgi:hypothetical protein
MAALDKNEKAGDIFLSPALTTIMSLLLGWLTRITATAKVKRQAKTDRV